MTQIYVTMNEYSMYKGQGYGSAFFTTVLLTHLHVYVRVGILIACGKYLHFT